VSGAGWERVEDGGGDAPREPRDPAPAAPEWTPPAPYRALGQRAKWVVVLLAVGIVVDLVAVGSDVAERLLLNDAASGKLLTDAEANTNDLRQGVIAAVQTVSSRSRPSLSSPGSTAPTGT
jgi:hypothetical protein